VTESTTSETPLAQTRRETVVSEPHPATSTTEASGVSASADSSVDTASPGAAQGVDTGVVDDDLVDDGVVDDGLVETGAIDEAVDAGAVETEAVDAGAVESGDGAGTVEVPDAAGRSDSSDLPDVDEAAVDEATEVTEPTGSELADRLENEGDIAADYLEELLDIADLDGDLDMDVEGDRAAVSIVGGDVRQLVGRDGEVLEALQELTRLAVYRETGERSRLMLDVGGFRADKRSRLEKVAAAAVAEVQESGQRKALQPMSPFERKVVHDAVAAAGLASASEGEEPRRYVVVLPA